MPKSDFRNRFMSWGSTRLSSRRRNSSASSLGFFRMRRSRKCGMALVLLGVAFPGICFAFQDPRRLSARNSIQNVQSRSNSSLLLSQIEFDWDDNGETSKIPSSWRKGKLSSAKIFDLVSRLRGGATSLFSCDDVSATGPSNKADKMVGGVLGFFAKTVAVQSVMTMLSSDGHTILDELADRLLSTESSRAVKMIRTIISQFPDHGVVDVFKEYPARDVGVAILALSKLQKASLSYAEKHHSLSKEVNDPELLEKLAHYAVFAKAAYGWKYDLAFRGRINLGDHQALLKQTGIDEENVIASHWQSKTHRPAYFLIRDVERRNLVLCIRGTWSARDLLTDLCCTGENFETKSGTKNAHNGMLEAARGVAEAIEETVETELAANPDYSLVVVGHSLGAGVAAVLGTLWEDKFPGLSVYGYGSPCVSPLDKEPTNHKSIVSVVGEGDPFSCLSLGHIADLSCAIAHLCENESLRTAILIRTGGPVAQMDEEDLKWSFDTMEELREKMTGDKMYPPGRILYISKRNLDHELDDTIALREMPASYFRDLRLHPRMLDLSRHVPTLYESYLQQLWNDMQVE